MSHFSVADAAGLFSLIAALHPTAQAFVKADKQTVAIWHSMLSDLTAEVLSEAVKRHAAVSKYPPSIAEIRETAIKLLNPDLEIDSGAAWGMVVETLKKGVNRQSLDALPDGVRVAAKAVGGWYMIAQSTSPDVIRAQFMRVYEQYVGNEIKQRQVVGGTNGQEKRLLPVQRAAAGLPE